MTDNIMTLIDYLRKVGLQEDLDFCREAAQFFGQKIIDLEAEEVIGAQKSVCVNDLKQLIKKFTL